MKKTLGCETARFRWRLLHEEPSVDLWFHCKFECNFVRIPILRFSRFFGKHETIQIGGFQRKLHRITLPFAGNAPYAYGRYLGIQYCRMNITTLGYIDLYIDPMPIVHGYIYVVLRLLRQNERLRLCCWVQQQAALSNSGLRCCTRSNNVCDYGALRDLTFTQ